MKKIITTLSAGVLAVAFSSASFSGHHESGEGMDMGGMPMPPGVPGFPPMSETPPMGMDGMPMPPGAPPIGMDGMPMPPGAPPIGKSEKFLKDVGMPPSAPPMSEDAIEAATEARKTVWDSLQKN